MAPMISGVNNYSSEKSLQKRRGLYKSKDYKQRLMRPADKLWLAVMTSEQDVLSCLLRGPMQRNCAEKKPPDWHWRGANNPSLVYKISIHNLFKSNLKGVAGQ